MTVQGYDEVNYKLLGTRGRSSAPGVEPVTVLPTKAAIDYFAEQTREKQNFDKTEMENEEFKEAVSTHTSYPKNYTLLVYFLDCLEELGDNRCKENSMLEKDCIHGYNCKRINNCTCTSELEVKRNNDIRKEKRRQDNNIKRQPKRTKKQKEHLERWNKERKRVEDSKWGDY